MNKRGNLSKNIFLKNRKGQVWVETVIYLLIAFVMIGLVLSFIKPKIEELKDKAIIEQSIQILQDIDNSILNIGSSGNKRLFEIGIKKGSLTIDSEDDTIIFEIDSTYQYSEPGQPVQTGNIQALTVENGRNSKVTLKRDFSEGYNITYNGEEVNKTLSQASNPYKVFITNEGTSSNKIAIDFSVE
jgi:type II secretory pathway pseudopilin PulG